MDDHLAHAKAVAEDAHKGQKDKTGNPYFDHCKRVAALVSGDTEQIVAYLHDILEKGPGWTSERLIEEGFPLQIVEAVVAMTRKQGESEDQFVLRAASHPVARSVKEADLMDNLAQCEQAGLDASKFARGLATLKGA